MESLEACVKAPEEGIQAPVDKLHDQFRPAQEDTEALNEKVAQVMAKAI